MIILTENKKGALEQNARDQFVQELALEISEINMANSGIDESNLQEIVYLGISRAAYFGLTQKSAVRTYVHIMLWLGSFFDTDPIVPWAREILSNPNRIGSQPYIANALRDESLSYLEQVNGASGEYVRAFCDRLIEVLKTDGEANLVDADIRHFIERSFPKKAEHLGNRVLDALVNDSWARCKAAGFRRHKSVLAISGLRMIHGAWVYCDPQFPWLMLNNLDNRSRDDEWLCAVTLKHLNHL